MNFKKQDLKNYLLHDTPVENLFITDYARTAPGDYVKVYLLALMYANINEQVQAADLAKALGMSVSRVTDAWNYWKEQGIVKIYGKGENVDNYQIEFVSIRDEAFGRNVNVNKKLPDLAAKLDDDRLSKLYKQIEENTGRLLEAKEPQAVAEWIKDLQINPELVAYAYKYCNERNLSTRVRYVETILKDWKQRGLNNVEAVKDYLSLNDQRFDSYRKIFRELGFSRVPSEPEKRLMDQWLDEDQFTMNEILDACKRITGIGNPNLNYINSVLNSTRQAKVEEQKDMIPEKRGSFEEFYEKIRKENEIKTYEKREKIYKQIPRLREIANELKDCGYNMSRALLAGSAGKDALAKAAEQQRVLNLEKATLLRSSGYGEKELDQIYSCSKCRDTGLLDDGSKCDCYLG